MKALLIYLFIVHASMNCISTLKNIKGRVSNGGKRNILNFSPLRIQTNNHINCNPRYRIKRRINANFSKESCVYLLQNIYDKLHSKEGKKRKRKNYPLRYLLHFLERTPHREFVFFKPNKVTCVLRKEKDKKKMISKSYHQGKKKHSNVGLMSEFVKDDIMKRGQGEKESENKRVFMTYANKGCTKNGRDILEALCKKERKSNNLFLNYDFFEKEKDNLLNLEEINDIDKRRRSCIIIPFNLSYLNNIFFHIFQIEQFEMIYNPEVTSRIYAYKKSKEREYLDNFNSSHYANSFILLYPPPNLSGQLHAGHYFNFIQQNIIFLFNKHVLSRYSIPLLGADHGGLSSHEAFSKICESNWSKEKYISEIKSWQEMLKENILTNMQKMNIVVDKNHFYSTMDEDMKTLVTNSFYILYKNNMIVNKFYPLYYCPNLNTIVSKLDLEFSKPEYNIWKVKMRMIDAPDKYKLHSDSKRDSFFEEKNKTCLDDFPTHSYTERPKETNEVKFFEKKSYNFVFLNCACDASGQLPCDASGPLPCDASGPLPCDASQPLPCDAFQPLPDDASQYIHIEIEKLEDLKKIVAILHYSPKKEKNNRNKYVLLPLIRKAVPLIYSNERNAHPLLCNNTVPVEDLFIPVFSSNQKYDNYADFFNLEKDITITNATVGRNQNGRQGRKNSFVKQILENGHAQLVEAEKAAFKSAYYKNNKCILTLQKQWCLKYDKLKKLFFDCPCAKKKGYNNVLPEKYRKYFLDESPAMNNDWILNRQVPYGHPIPLFKYESCEKKEEKNKKFENFICCVYGNTIDHAYNNLVKSNIFEKKEIKKEFLKRDDDVLDNWFSSSLYFLHCLNQMKLDLCHLSHVKHHLIDFIFTGKDILHPWILRSVVLLHYLMGHFNGIQSSDVFKNVQSDVLSESVSKVPSSLGSASSSSSSSCSHVTLLNMVRFHGILKDEKGKKISKSDENATYYESLVEGTNLDQVRLTFSLIDRDTEDIVLDKNKIRKSNKFLRKIWNIGNFIKKKCSFEMYKEMKNWMTNSSEVNFNILKNLKNSSFPRISNIGIFCTYIQIINSVLHEMKNNYNVGRSIHIIHNFVMNTFSKFYLRYHHYLLPWCLNEKNDERIITNFLTIYMFRGILKILYPFIPHITEVLFIQLFLKNEIDKNEKYTPSYFSLPLSSNYDLFKNEEFYPSEEIQLQVQLFSTFVDIYNILLNYKKKNTTTECVFNIFLNNLDTNKFPIEYFKNEEYIFRKFHNMNIFFSSYDQSILGQQHPKEQQHPCYHLFSKNHILYDSTSFTITVHSA
ncbi:valine--tRNA ligase [Plasmodium gonderi]|uniref:valine--tRNA ligase n=1 Tax=Plasmodium gonderi TaxID=77519 RepID=A0A1Y1JDU8_PLAGO|nr:valine--tRNA ligase [Plasmodium gonderi]GAW80709.1 valine--tRNA ligase [Plasmodium gonderi]